MASKNDQLQELIDNRKENSSANPSQVVGDDLKKIRQLKLELYRLTLKMKEDEDLYNYSERFKKEIELKVGVQEQEEITLSFLASLPADSPRYNNVTNLLIGTVKELTLVEAIDMLREGPDQLSSDIDNRTPANQVVNADLKAIRQLKLKLYRLTLKMKEDEDLNNYSEQFKKKTNELKIGVPNEEEEITLSFLASLPVGIYKKKIESLIDDTTKELTLA